MPFGLTNAHETLMDLMNRVFKDYLDQFFFLSFLLMTFWYFAKIEDKHERHLRIIIDSLGKEAICCEFWTKQVPFSGTRRV